MLKTLAGFAIGAFVMSACASARDVGEHRPTIAWEDVTVQHCSQGTCEPLTFTLGNVIQLDSQRRQAILRGEPPDYNTETVTVLCTEDAVYNNHIDMDVANAVCHARVMTLTGSAVLAGPPVGPPSLFTIVGANGEPENTTSDHVTYNGCLKEAGQINQAIRRLGGRSDYPVRCVSARYASRGEEFE